MSELYPDSDMRLTEDQQRHTEQRILHDALLISQGAHVSELGRLVITETQYHALAAGESVNVATEKWLNRTIEDVLLGEAEPEEIPLAARMVNALKREQLMMRRDVLVAGRAKIFNVRNVGPRTFDVLEPALTNEFGIRWLDRPDASDIAQFCTDLRQISSIAITDRAIRNTDKSSYYLAYYGLSVQDVLDRREEIGEVPTWVPEEKQESARLRREQEIAAHIRAAEIFAGEFHAARQEQTQSD